MATTHELLSPFADLIEELRGRGYTEDQIREAVNSAMADTYATRHDFVVLSRNQRRDERDLNNERDTRHEQNRREKRIRDQQRQVHDRRDARQKGTVRRLFGQVYARFRKIDERLDDHETRITELTARPVAVPFDPTPLATRITAAEALARAADARASAAEAAIATRDARIRALEVGNESLSNEVDNLRDRLYHLERRPWWQVWGIPALLTGILVFITAFVFFQLGFHSRDGEVAGLHQQIVHLHKVIAQKNATIAYQNRELTAQDHRIQYAVDTVIDPQISDLLDKIRAAYVSGNIKRAHYLTWYGLTVLQPKFWEFEKVVHHLSLQRLYSTFGIPYRLPHGPHSAPITQHSLWSLTVRDFPYSLLP